MKICETGRARAVARIGGRVVLSVGLEFQAHSSMKGGVCAKLLQIRKMS
jgi:hypothetical protein